LSSSFQESGQWSSLSTTGGAEVSGVSERFGRAAGSEYKRLTRKRGRLIAEVAAIDEALAMMAPLVVEDAEPDGKLRGREIRELAVEVLAKSYGSNPIHYRSWLQLLEDREFRVAGKRPEAVFLNQVTRHPAVRATTQRGFYALDPEAARELASTQPPPQPPPVNE
jgi:hypothetical protein